MRGNQASASCRCWWPRTRGSQRPYLKLSPSSSDVPRTSRNTGLSDQTSNIQFHRAATSMILEAEYTEPGFDIQTPLRAAVVSGAIRANLTSRNGCRFRERVCEKASAQLYICEGRHGASGRGSRLVPPRLNGPCGLHLTFLPIHRQITRPALGTMLQLLHHKLCRTSGLLLSTFIGDRRSLDLL